ncbi:MAG: AEC family transporter [Rhodobacteraceae bacterium]|nr:AEC family transporter [Paracoccaceae bacterium]
MLSILAIITPVFALIVLGYGLRRAGIPGPGFWEMNDRLSYWVLMPALIFSQVSTSDFGDQPLGAFAATLLGGFALAVATAAVLSRLLGLKGPAATSVLQGGSRHNSFLVLAVSGAWLGPEGLAMAVLGVAILVPVTNIVVVTAMSAILRAADMRGLARLAGAILRDLARNPLILSVGAGVLANIAGARAIPVVHDAAAMLGAAALPILLLCVGAALRLRGMAADAAPLAAAFTAKLVAFPLATLAIGLSLGLPPVLLTVAMIFASVPTAAAAQALARLMGGDVPLMSAIITLQTAVSFLTLPVMMAMTAWIVGV